MRGFISYGTVLTKLKNPIFKESSLGILYNFLGILCGLITVSLLVNYLGKHDYGIWITMYSICNWISFLDGGFGNSIRNELTYSIVEKDYVKSRKVVTTGYTSVFLFLLIVYAIVIISHQFFDWNEILSDNRIDYNLVALFVFGFFLYQMVIRIIGKIYFAFGKSSTSFLVSFVSNFFVMVAIFIVFKMDLPNKIWNIAIIYSVVPLLVFLIFSFHFFYFEQPKYKPSLQFFDKSYINTVLSKGILFFMIQMSAGLLQSITPFFITLWFSATESADYQIAMRYYSMLVVFQNIILQTYWTYIAISFAEKNKEKLVKYLKSIVYLMILFLFLLLIMFFASELIFKIWLGKEISISQSLNLLSVIFILSVLVSKSFTNFLNATNNIKVQSFISFLIVLTYIPVIYVGVKFFNLGIESLILIPASFFIIQAFVAINEIRKVFNLKINK